MVIAAVPEDPSPEAKLALSSGLAESTELYSLASSSAQVEDEKVTVTVFVPGADGLIPLLV